MLFSHKLLKLTFNTNFRFTLNFTVLGATANSCIYGIVGKSSEMLAAQGIHKAVKVSDVV
jgi:hypothetical protein